MENDVGIHRLGYVLTNVTHNQKNPSNASPFANLK